MKIKFFPFQITIESDIDKKDVILFTDRKTGILYEENVPGKKSVHFLYTCPLGKILLKSIFCGRPIQYLQGLFMDIFLSRFLIKSFIRNYQIDMNDSLLSENQFKSFNAFFTRKLKQGSRFVNDDDNKIISPADGKILVFEKADQSMNFYIKGTSFDITGFIADKKLSEQFVNASMAIIRLAPVDYHRFHFPVSCIPSKSVLIKGKYYSVSPLALRRNIEIFNQNKREICLLKSKQGSDILMIEVGATFVGGIKQTYVPGIETEKGMEKGFFKFGGSTVVLLFKEDTIQFDKDLLDNTRKGFETTIRMGESIASFVE